MKALSLHQPWATLVALGVKTIETRSWSTSYRGPLAIHATERPPEHDERYGGRALPNDRQTVAGSCFEHGGDWIVTPSFPAIGHVWLPLGAIVATCTLVDVVPIEVVLPGVDRPRGAPPYSRGYDKVTTHPLSKSANLYRFVGNNGYDVSDQRPYGDFTPGRFAWLLDDIKATTQRCPGCWGRGGTLGSHADLTGSQLNDGGAEAAWVITARCGACNMATFCDPIPVKGHQGLWNWDAT